MRVPWYGKVGTVRPPPLLTAASGKAAEWLGTAPRIDLSVVLRRSSSFRRSLDHLSLPPPSPPRRCARPAPMTYASYSFQGEQPDQLGAPDGATPPADSLSGSLRVILELLLNAAQHLAAPQRCCSRGAPGAPSRLHCERTGSNLENLSATLHAPCAALQLLGGRRERQTKCASVKCFRVKPHE